jgi:hypothetical protein
MVMGYLYRCISSGALGPVLIEKDERGSTQLCFPGMRRIPANYPNCRMLHTWNASHSLDVHI